MFFFVVLTQVCAQQDTVLQSKIFIENANNQITDVSGPESIQFLNGDVRVYKDSVFMFCDSARLVNSDRFIALGNVVMVQSDTIELFCDSLYFNSTSDIVKLYDNVTLENGDQQLFTDRLTYNTADKIATYQDTALLKVEETLLQSKKGFYNVDRKLATFYDEVILEKEELTLRTDSLQYDTENKSAIFVKPTRIVDKEKRIYCEEGFYNLDNNNARFIGDPQLIDGESLAIADTITYDALDSILTLSQNAQYTKPDLIATADLIIQDLKAEATTLLGNASFLDKGKLTTGQELYYDDKLKNVSVNGKAFFQDGSAILEADEVIYSDLSGDGLASGNAVYRDTTSDIILRAKNLVISESSNVKATGTDTLRPYLTQLLEADTMYMAADTMYRNSIVIKDSLGIETLDSFAVFSGTGKVKILETSFTAICDSLLFSEQDSIFRLFNNPVVWADSTQFSGDTILMYLKNKELDKIEIINKGFIINELEVETFNQIKGKKIDVYFVDGGLDSMEVNGSAESLYFFQDEEDAFIGVNKTLCGHMTFYFKEKELDDIRFFQKPESVLTPIQEVNVATERIKGFNWQIKKSPLNLSSIIRLE